MAFRKGYYYLLDQQVTSRKLRGLRPALRISENGSPPPAMAPLDTTVPTAHQWYVTDFYWRGRIDDKRVCLHCTQALASSSVHDHVTQQVVEPDVARLSDLSLEEVADRPMYTRPWDFVEDAPKCHGHPQIWNALLKIRPLDAHNFS
ncbi:hypothetical protein X801_09715 [Opisthorchis viverrini]|uniref:Uncharacterized protein n=1 Tax=Opisthorchis viverrini TaxID=6198 RepID=A0A1S8WJ66_OPIVI|nr:hypothetical protein X801_09715 [Opisthorchis viverrini]